MKKLLLQTILLTGLVATLIPSRAEPVLIGNKEIGAQNLDAEGIKAVLLGKKVSLGSAHVVVVIAKASAGQEAFLQEHVSMNTSQFQNHWRRLFMTGSGGAPKIVETEADAVKLVAETAGAIAVADSAAAAGLPVVGK